MASLGNINTLAITLSFATPNVYAADSVQLSFATPSVYAADSFVIGFAYVSGIAILTPNHTLGTLAPSPDIVINPCHVRDGSIFYNGVHDHGATCIPAVLPPTTLNPIPDTLGTLAPSPDIVINPCHVRDGSIFYNGVHDHGATCIPAETIPSTGILNPNLKPKGIPAPPPDALPTKKSAVATTAPTTKTVLRRYGVAGSVGISRQTGQVITGLAYLQDRMASCLSMRIGTHPMRRLKGSRIPELMDRPLNSATVFELQVAAMDALSSASNGFADLNVVRTVVDSVVPGKVSFSVIFEQNNLVETVMAVEVAL